MYEFVEGLIEEITPSYVIVNNNGIGYYLNISLTTYTGLEKGKNFRFLIHQVIREDAHLMFGFSTPDERNLFRALITVSGIGANTARMMLSSASPAELRSGILGGQVDMLKSIKGIGLKTAQRVIVELKDKLDKHGEPTDLNFMESGPVREEAMAALLALGFNKTTVEKVISKILKEKTGASVEEIIRTALQNL